MIQLSKQHLQKYFYALLASSLLWGCTSSPAQENAAPRLGANLVQNPGFENGAADWSIPANTAQVADDVARSGNKSLEYTNTDPKQYKFFRQKLEGIKPGQYLQFSVWVKGKDLNGLGATLYVQSLDAKNKYINGSYPAGFSGTNDWRQIKDNFLVPEDAASTWVLLYLKRDVTGTAWFDDVEVRVVEPEPFIPFLRFPNYRGQVQQGDNTSWKMDVEINPQPEWQNTAISIHQSLMNAAGKVLLEKTSAAATSDKIAKFTFDPPVNLPVGDYTLQQSITAPDGAKTTTKFPIHVVQKMPKVYIDKDGFTVVDGKRFFPLGLYLGDEKQTTDEHLQRINDGGFNTILTYGYGYRQPNPKAYMARAQKHHLHVIYAMSDMLLKLQQGTPKENQPTYDLMESYLKMIRDEPNLLAWYINDERPPGWLSRLKKVYDLCTQLDPHHPTFQVLANGQTSALEKYFSVTDVLGNDPYPVGRVGETDLTMTSEHTTNTVEAAHGAKSVWIVPQMMDWAVYKKNQESHSPSLDELRNQAYQAIIGGAKGLIFYTYYDMFFEKYPRNDSTRNEALFLKRWANAAAMGQEIKALIPAILNGQNIALSLPQSASIKASALEYQNDLLILLANPYYEEKSVTLELPQGWQIAQPVQGEIKSTFADGNVTFTLPSVGSGVFRLEKRSF